MLSRIWVTILVLLGWVLLGTWLVLVCREGLARVMRDLASFFGGRTKDARLLLGVLFVALWIVAGTKPGGGGTNGVQMASNPIGGGLLPMEFPGVTPHAVPPVADAWECFTTIASSNTSRTLSADDFLRGFVMARVGTNEVFDFSPPPNAVVCHDWRAFGAATDWVYADVGSEDDESHLRLHADGWAEMPGGVRYWPFRAPLGIAPEANWHLIAGNEAAAAPEDLAPSQAWHGLTPRNTLLATWQNALLDRDAGSPLSFQAEFFPDGRFTYRYDFSRIGGNGGTTLLNATLAIGASLGGGLWTTNTLPTNTTSLAFHPLSPDDAYDHDPDGDGLPTIDELFVHGTDPRNADTDFDGLTDREELFVYSTDPLDSHSANATFCDGFAVRLGDADPFSCPEGSTNTVLEHVFYSGTTNGVFAYPRSSDAIAVLRVSASGSGSGDLVVGDRVVPLVAPPPLRSASPNPLPPLLVQLVKGETYPVYFRGDELLELALDSDDFAFGVLPSCTNFGYVNFPNTVATTPCIHNFRAQRKRIRLEASRGAGKLVCTWQGGGSRVEVENDPPRAATVTGKFPPHESAGITYSLSHPQYLFGRTDYDQTIRFCPRPSNSGDDSGDDPEDASPWDPDDDDSNNADGGDGEHEEYWCCLWGVCGDAEGCGNDCGCGCGSHPGGGHVGGGEPGGGKDPGEDDDFDDVCPVHAVPYAECAHLHEDDYTNAVHTVQHLGGVLYIREPPVYEQIDLDVPSEHVNCCPCPSHWTNCVEVAHKSSRLRLIDSNGLPFRKTETSCQVNLAGVRPSSAVGDAVVAFSRCGKIYQRRDKTVLGVAIGSHDVDLAACNALGGGFGFPMTVCTNVAVAPSLNLVTKVKLPGGNVHLELVGATAPFAVWYYDGVAGEYRRLLDSATMPAKNLPMAYWKALMRRAGVGNSPELPVYLTSPSPGTVVLKFRYWTVVDGKFVQDEADQRITSVLPPLRFDVIRDGAVDGGDAAAWLDGRPFRYWVNEDTVRGDWIGQVDNAATNSTDLLVNGTFDLVNLFPAALDLKPFMDAWQDRVTYTLRPERGGSNSFNFCFADLPWAEAGRIQTSNVTTRAGQPLSSAPLTRMPAGGWPLPYSLLEGFPADSGLLVGEARSRGASLRLDVAFGDKVLYTYAPPMDILPVREMYNWCNYRHFSGDGSGRPTAFHDLPGEGFSKSLVFLHGVNVPAEGAEQWGDILFKRLWLSGSRARFYNVGWRSDIGSPANYHQNASNAFEVASRIVSALTNAIPGEKVFMAHSLGNMVVSSMIQDYGLRVSRYIMCNSAVPAEAYDTSRSLRTPKLVHPDWEEYPTNSWAASWHALFKDDAGDDRKFLGWPGRFTNAQNVAVNFYSTGDEVLELATDNDVYIYTGIWDSRAHHSWHKQELFKGRGFWVGAGATDWSGWNIRENILGVNKISVAEALSMSDADFRTNTVFHCYPPSMNSTNINLLVRGAHLAQGIPALTAAAGATDLTNVFDQENNFNLDLDNPGIEFPNGWPMRSTYPNRWLHSDIKNISYFFNHKAFEKVVEKGGLR